MIVLAPIPYHLSLNSKANYRDPAYLLTDANDMDICKLIQAYVDRWEIEKSITAMKNNTWASAILRCGTTPPWIVSPHSLWRPTPSCF